MLEEVLKNLRFPTPPLSLYGIYPSISHKIQFRKPRSRSSTNRNEDQYYIALTFKQRLRKLASVCIQVHFLVFNRLKDPLRRPRELFELQILSNQPVFAAPSWKAPLLKNPPL
jgi:hypothetical protein